MDQTLYEQLSSSDPILILSGLVVVSEDVKDTKVSRDYANTIFHKVFPLLNHNNYKIRALSFSIVEFLFVRNLNDLTDIFEILSILIFSLASVNNSIVKSTNVCLRILFESFDISIWWNEVEHNILYSKSNAIRIYLLSLIADLKLSVPVEPIVKLLDDPNSQIRELAEQIFLNAGKDKIRECLQESKISFNVYQKYFQTFLPQIPQKTVDVHGTVHIIRKDDDKRILNGQGKKYKRAEKKSKSKKSLHKESSISRPSALDNEGNKFISGLDSVFNLNSQSKLKEEQQNANLNNDDSEENDPKKYRATIENFSSIQHHRRSSFSRGIKDKILSENDSKRLTSYYSNYDGKSRNNDSLSKNEDRNEIENEFMPALGRKNNVQSSTYSEEEESKNDFLGSLASNDFKNNQDLNSHIDQKTVGRLVKKTNLQKQLSLRDMSKMDWIERMTYLNHFKKICELNSYSFNYPAIDVVKCLLTAAFPLHKKVSPLLARLLTKCIYQNPEVLHTLLIDIVRFLLHAIRPPVSLAEEDGAGDFLDAILLESSPDELIEAALVVKSENQRPLLIEEVVLLMYKKKPDILLSQLSIRNLLCYLLHLKTKTESGEKLLYLICQKETSEVLKFFNLQSREMKRQLIHYIPKEEIERLKTKKTKEPEVVISNKSQANLLIIINQEMKKGPKCNFKRLSLALQNVRIENKEMFDEMFIFYLKALAKLPDASIKANSISICDISSKTFNSASVFTVFDRPIVLPDVVKGFRIFVWHCPMTLLNDSDKYYHRLYEIFKDSDGNVRKQIVGISIAIEKVTDKSILDESDVIPPHKELIQNLIDQYDVYDP